MHYIANFIEILLGTIHQLIDHNLRAFVLILLAGLALAITLWLLCTFFGRLFYKPYRLSIEQHLLCGLLAVMVVITVPLYTSAAYMEFSTAKIIAHWREALVANSAWQGKEFKRQYHAIKEMGLEDFSNYPEPELGSTSIPLSHTESRLKIGQMTAEAALENFQLNFPLPPKIFSTTSFELANTVSQDVNSYFQTNQDSTYPHSRGIQLVAQKMYSELVPQIPRIIFITRLTLILLVVFGYALCLTWIGYAALCKIRVHSPHSSLSTHS